MYVCIFYFIFTSESSRSLSLVWVFTWILVMRWRISHLLLSWIDMMSSKPHWSPYTLEHESSTWTERLSLQFPVVWYLNLTGFHLKLPKYWRAWPYLKLSIVCAKCDIATLKVRCQGGWYETKESSWQAKECLKAHWRGAQKNKSLNFLHNNEEA